MRTDLHPRPVHEDAMRARCGEGCATRPPLGRQSNGSELARLLDFWLVATMATMATLGSRPLKDNLAMILVGWFIITPPPSPSFFFQVSI